MKVGDKVLCKNSRMFLMSGKFSIFSNKYYEVLKITKNPLITNLLIGGLWIAIRNNYNDYDWYIMDIIDKSKYQYSIMSYYDYFYTDKELRKMKIEKIESE